MMTPLVIVLALAVIAGLAATVATMTGDDD